MTDYMKKFQPRTRGGYEYEIFAERDGELYGRAKDMAGYWQAKIWRFDGTDASIAKQYDLLPIEPEKVEGWIQVYPVRDWVYSRDCLDTAEQSMIACRRIIYTSGERRSERECLKMAKHDYDYFHPADPRDHFERAIYAFLENWKIGRVWDSTPEEV